MRKILLINGSPHKDGNTYRALQEVVKGVGDEIQTEIVWIGNQAIRGCIGCGACAKKGNGLCVFNDDICNEMILKMREADGLVVGSPVYYGTPAGQVLCLIHRMFYAGGADVQNKPAAAITVCRRGGATAAFQTLQMPFQMMNMPLATSQYWNIAYGRSAGEVAEDEEGLQTMRRLGRNLAWMVKNLNRDELNEPWEERKWTHFIR